VTTLHYYQQVPVILVQSVVHKLGLNAACVLQRTVGALIAYSGGPTTEHKLICETERNEVEQFI